MTDVRDIGAVMLCFLFLVGAATVFGVDANTAPDWLVIEKGKQLFDSGDYGESLFYFRQARERYPNVPEVEYWIGRVFEAEGEYSLAELQYKLALERAEYFEIRDDVYEVHYRLADIYLIEKHLSSYVAHLESILNRDVEARRSAGDLRLDGRLLSRTLAQKGLDKLFELYRLPDYGGLDAYYRLGVYELRTGLVENASELLTLSAVITFTTVINHLLERDPEYRFTTFDDLLTGALKYRIVEDYFFDTDAFGQLYALALALRGSREAPKIEVSSQLLALVRIHDAQGFWGRRAVRQLEKAFEDDFMIVF
jgi:tetratricopeptide (TPR) repeat protein